MAGHLKKAPEQIQTMFFLQKLHVHEPYISTLHNWVSKVCIFRDISHIQITRGAYHFYVK